MLIHPRAALASGLAAAAGATLMLLGRIDGSLPVVVVLAVTARAASFAASPDPAAARGLALLVRSFPAWIGLIVVLTLRAGSPQLADVWGANAVAGLALARGDASMLAAIWLAALGVVCAIAAPRGGGWSPIVTADPWWRLEIPALLVQVALVAGLVAGPQVTAFADLVPWIVALLVTIGALAVAGGISRRPEQLARASLLAAIAGVALAVIGSGS